MVDNSLGQITHCRVCGAPQPRQFFDLGEQPLANSLLHSPDEQENFYPLALYHCANCSLVQLGYAVDPKTLFSNYVWVTGTAKTTRDYAEKFADQLLTRTGDAPGYILEIASNDGTFLKPLQARGREVLGIDPAENIAAMANKAGIPTEVMFWSKPTAEEIIKKHGQAGIVFARNVMPHVANTRDFMEGLALALEESGTLVLEAHYAGVILKDLHYDSIYHEHLCYFTLKSLEKLMNDFGLYAFDMADSPINAGNIVIYAKKIKGDESAGLVAFRAAEETNRVNEYNSWEGFAKRSFEHRDKLIQILKNTQGRNVVGWGASARSSTMLNFAKIGPDLLPVIVDLNPLKQGLYTAGTHIPIRGEEAMNQKPTHIFILAWTFASEIMDSLKNKFNFKGECIIPLPRDVKIIKIDT